MGTLLENYTLFNLRVQIKATFDGLFCVNLNETNKSNQLLR